MPTTSTTVKNKNNSNTPSLSNQNKNKAIQNNNSNKTNINNNSNTSLPNSAENNGWTTQTTKRTHSSSSFTTSDPPLSPQESRHVNKKLFSSRNRYEVFSSMEQSPNPSAEDAQTSLTETVANTITKHIIPPPIFIKGVDDFPGVCTVLIDLIGVDNFHCKSSADQLKIQTANPESYRALVQFLRKENAEFHTYQLQEDKPIRVVIRNIHPTTPCELIKEELILRLFEVRQVTSVLHRLNKNPLPLFFVDLEPTTHSNEIFQLTSLLHTKIIVEEPYKPKSISQCANCQDYGHTKAYCGYSPRCVRCGKDHHSSSCPNSRDEPPKCALCQENHPASYKGCAVYKNLQRRKNPNTINNNKNLSVKTNYNLKSKNVQDSHPPNSSMHLPAQPLTYADATSGLSPKPTPPPLDLVTPPSATDINNLLTSFLINKNINLNIRLKSNLDIDEAVNNFTTLIQSAAWTALKPIKTVNSNNIINSNFNYPLIPEEIRCLIVEKRRARARYHLSRLPSHKSAYNKLANSLKKILTKHKANAFEQKLHNLSVANGSLWRETKQLLKYKSPSTPLKKADNTLAISDAEKAEVFKTHLSNIFQPHADILDPQHIDNVRKYLDSPLPNGPPVKYTTPNEIKNIILKHSNKKSLGFDLITAEVAKCLPKKAIVLLTYIFNAIFRLLYFPLMWKFSHIVMFAKPNKPPDAPNAYRPISLLPFFSKIFERLILHRLSPHVISNNILPSSQFGFRAKHNTIHQVHRLGDSISTSLERKQYCSCVFLDISQVFDRVWHDGLLYKLRNFLPPSLFLLTKSYLTDRYFQIRIGTCTSQMAMINAGVPQGGILSPLLFNIYASDQPVTENTIVADYADDKDLISIHENPLIASGNLQTHLNLISSWYTKWRIKLNHAKSIHTTFTLKHGLCPPVSLDNIPIPVSDTVKYLGLILDKRLT
ncbi:hypothetical protein QTP88_022192 [Uroleucon formosanum]